MQIFGDKRIAPGWLVTQINPPHLSSTFFLKATFFLQPTGSVMWEEEPDPVSGDVHFEEDAERSIYYSSDFVPFKPRADVFLVGKCYAPARKPILAVRVRIVVGAMEKSLVVIGNRYWGKKFFFYWFISDPEPFTNMELRYEKSFGGDGFNKNPVGKGFGWQWFDSVKKIKPLPNIEDPLHLVCRITDQPNTSGFGPLSGNWEERNSLVGTYKGKWLEERWPWFPVDFDWGYFNSAPLDQQINGYLRGDEELMLSNLHPECEFIRTRLPGVRARCFINERVGDIEMKFREVPLNLDTLWIDSNSGKLVLVWRGNAPVRTMKLKEIQHLLILTESLSDSPRSLAKCKEILDEHIRNGGESEESQIIQTPTVSDEKSEIFDHEQEVAAIEAEFQGLEEKAIKTESDAKARLIGAGIDPNVLMSQGPQESLVEVATRFTASLQSLQQKNPEYLLEIQSLGEVVDEFVKLDSETKIMEEEEELQFTREIVELKATRGESFLGKDLEKLDLSGLNLAGLDFRKAALRETNLSGSNLSGANFEMADLSQANLSKADLSGAILNNADLTDAKLTNAKLTRLSLTNANFSGLDLVGLDFSGSAGRGVDFSGANLNGAKFFEAKLPASDFCKSNLAEADFRKADLQNAQFEEVNARGVNMEAANITGLHASDISDFTNGNFKNVKGEGSIWETSLLNSTDFSCSILTQTNFSESSLLNAIFDRAELSGAVFDDSLLENAILTNSNLLRASFERANLTATDFTGSNLYEGGFFEAVISKTNFHRANIKRTIIG